MDNRALAAILAEVIGGGVPSPRRHAQDLAARTTRDHIRAGLPTPNPGDVIRCVFSAGRKAFQHDPFIFQDGVVYDVVKIGIDAIIKERITPEDYDRIAMSMAESAALFPNAPGFTLLIRNRATGEEMNTTYPCAPGTVFSLVSPEAVDEPQQMDIAPGTFFRFTDMTIIAKNRGNISTGTSYRVNQRKPVCSCSDPECPGKGQYSYLFLDDAGEETETMIPFSYLGTCEPVKQ